MAKISLMAKILAISSLNLSFTSISVQRTKDNELIAVLQLSSPIEEVRGSQDIEINGKKIGVKTSDVTELKVFQDDFEKIDWDDVTDTGSYTGAELTLDVSKKLECWLVSKSFAAAGSEMRQTYRNNRLTEMAKLLGVDVTGGKDTKDAKAPKIVAEQEPVGAGKK